MDKKKGRYIKELAYYSSLGLSVALSIVIGLFLGRWLDQKFNTDPWLMFVFLGFGIAAGFRNIGLMIIKSRRF